MIFFTSDQHYGHQRVAKMTGRPFPHGEAGVPAMNGSLIRRYCETVDQDDEVWFAGDFAMGTISYTLPFIEGLPGRRKVLVAGNHDRCSPAYWHIFEDIALARSDADWAIIRRTENSRAMWEGRYRDAGFTNIYAGPVEMAIAGTPMWVSHFPYKGGGDSQAGERFSRYRLADSGHWLICGHVHNTWRQKGRMINVGVDAWGGYPVSEDQIAKLIAAGPQDLPVLPWT